MAALSEQELNAGLQELPGWATTGSAISKEYRFADFAGAIGFVVRLGIKAEAANHHPDLDIRYDKVAVTLSTHSEGGITRKDLDLAGVADMLAQ